jgi:CRP-like cAMP-binding protein
MDKKKLLEQFQSHLPLSPQKAEILAEKFQYKEIAKNDFLLKEGKIPNETYFLLDGYIRSYTLDTEGAEVTTMLYGNSSFATDFVSFFKRQATKENLQALTDCRLWYLTYEEVQVNFHTIPEFREWGRSLLLSNYSVLKDRMLAMIQLTAEQRYLNLIASQPEIFQNVPLKMIASYLGITDTSLSRIRKDINKSKKK